MQVSSAGYHAFLAAHTNMDKIKLACDNTEQHINSIMECIREGDSSDINTFVPVSLESMLETANECAEWSREIVNKFKDALNLLVEVHCSCHASQMTNEEKIKELERRKKELESEKEASQKSKQEKQERIQTLEKTIAEEEKQYLKDFEETQYKIRNSKQEVITVEDQLEEIKLVQEKAAQEVKEARAARGIFHKFFSIDTDEVIDVLNKEKEEAEKVKKEKQKVETKRKEVANEIETEEKIIKEKKEVKQNKEKEKYDEKKSSLDDMNELANRISAALIELNSNDVKKLDLDDIKNLLREGIEQVALLEEKWKILVLFFESVADIVEVAMKKAIKDFSKATGSAIQATDLSTFKKKMLTKLAYIAYSTCSGVSSVATGYLKISTDYLMPSIVELGTLLALDSEQDAEKIKQKTESIQLRCKNAVEYIGHVVKLMKLENENKMKALEMEPSH